MSAAEQTEPKIVEVTDERTPLARRAIALIQSAISDVHPARFLIRELEETRTGAAEGGGYHLLAMVEGDDDEPIAAASGAYLAAVNCGFVSYLAVHPDHRSRGLGHGLRARLVDVFRMQAKREHGVALGAVVGEVEQENPWLRLLVRSGRAVALDVPYFHPWMSRACEGLYSLYREPLGDPRRELPARDVADLIEAIWRRAYRVDDPDRSGTYRYMMDVLAERDVIGQMPEFAGELYTP